MLGACCNPTDTSCEVLVHVLAFLWVPVSNVTHYHKEKPMSFTRIKTAFGIVAAITIAILLAVAEGAATTASLIQTGAMANSLNTVIEQSSVALSTQQLINVHFHTITN